MNFKIVANELKNDEMRKASLKHLIVATSGVSGTLPKLRNSIFNEHIQKRYYSDFSKIEKLYIRLLFREEIKAGMEQDELRAVISMLEK